VPFHPVRMKAHRTLAAARRRTWSCLALIALSWSSGTRLASASAMVRMDADALVAGADRILVGTVERTEAHFASSTSRTIVTDVTLHAELGLLGVPGGSRFVVRHLGGEVAGVGQRVFGEASYRTGERVLLFAVERQGSYWTLGMSQGAWHVRLDDAGVERVVEPAGQSEGLDEVVEHVRSIVARRARP
jgi:hypothetical protein